MGIESGDRTFRLGNLEGDIQIVSEENKDLIFEIPTYSDKTYLNILGVAPQGFITKGEELAGGEILLTAVNGSMEIKLIDPDLVLEVRNNKEGYDGVIFRVREKDNQ